MIPFVIEASPAAGYGRLLRCLAVARHLKKSEAILFTGQADRTSVKIIEKTKFAWRPLKEAATYLPEPPRLVFLDAPTHGTIRSFLDIILTPGHSTLFQFRENEREEALPGQRFDLYPPFSDSGESPGNSSPIIHPQFRHFHNVSRKYKKHGRSVLLCLGGEIAYRTVRGLADMLNRHRFHVKIAGDFLLRKADKKGLRRLYPGLRFTGECQSLARAFFEADSALITPGTAAAEAAAAGTPALYVSVRKRHTAEAAWWAQQGAGIDAGLLENLSEDRRQAMGKSGKSLVDARGLFRLLDGIQPILASE